MSGHSKWSKVKHQKATTDAVKSAAFTRASRGITVAVKEGGGITDPEKNFRLRLAIDLARAVNMPKDTIERAIDRAKGSDAGSLDTVTYEGYGPGGVAMLVEAATDNHQRTSAHVKHQFDRFGGSIASPGAVSYQFRRRGVLLIDKPGHTFDEIFEASLSAGADDVQETEDVYEVYTAPSDISAVRDRLRGVFPVTHTALVMQPTQTVSVPEDTAAKISELIQELESSEDVSTVYSNMSE